MGSLYDRDLALWAAEQAQALRTASRAGSNLAVDWDNVAEEIESLGITERRALASHILVVLEHLMKLQASPAQEPVRGWRDSIRRARRDIERLLAASPSLRRDVPAMLADETAAARVLVRASMADFGEQPLTDLDAITYAESQVLGDWLP